jgi:hypothetical protein
MTLGKQEFERYMASETGKRSNLIKSNKIHLD